MILDFLDCDIVRSLYKNKDFCNTESYQIQDKIVDSMCYALILLYIVMDGEKFTTLEIQFIVFLFLYRMVGVVLFVLYTNRSYLFYFPNFFLEITLALTIIHKYQSFVNYKIIIICAVMFYKVLTEYIQHYNKSIYKKIY